MSHPEAGEVTGRMTDEGVSHSENNTQEHTLSPGVKQDKWEKKGQCPP